MRMKALLFLSCSSLATCACAQEYRLVLQTVFDEQQVTAYKVENELVYEDQKQTTYRPVYETDSRAPLHGRSSGHRNQ